MAETDDTKRAYDAFLDMVKASRTVRRFDESVPLTQAQLEMLVDAARFAPCARNAQELRFHVVSDDDERARVFTHLHWAAALKDWEGPAAGERPSGYIVILGPERSITSVMHGYDAGIAAQTIMLAAHTMGLGGCIIKSFDKGLADDLTLISGESPAQKGLAPSLALALGVPAERVVLEPATTEHGLTYWRSDPDSVHHVPKRLLDELLA